MDFVFAGGDLVLFLGSVSPERGLAFPWPVGCHSFCVFFSFGGEKTTLYPASLPAAGVAHRGLASRSDVRNFLEIQLFQIRCGIRIADRSCSGAGLAIYLIRLDVVLMLLSLGVTMQENVPAENIKPVERVAQYRLACSGVFCNCNGDLVFNCPESLPMPH